MSRCRYDFMQSISFIFSQVSKPKKASAKSAFVMPLARWDDDSESSSASVHAATASGWRYDATTSSETLGLHYQAVRIGDHSMNLVYLFKSLNSGCLFEESFLPSDLQPRTGNSEDESNSSSEDSSSSEVLHAASGVVDLTLQRLQSLHAVENESNLEPGGEYVTGGLSKARCKKVLEQPRCPCKCTMPLRVLMMLCQAFWHLNKTTQDSLLWSIQMEAGSGKKKWALQGNRICKDAWVAFLGIGKGRLNRCKRNFFGKDQRSISGPGGY